MLKTEYDNGVLICSIHKTPISKQGEQFFCLKCQRQKTNILVQYDGGGYDGCIWEYNYFYIDEQGTFENIAASGTGGITNLKDAMDLLENNGNSFSTDVLVYCLDSEEDMKRFAEETACPHVLGVIRWFNNYNMPDAEPFAICLECGCKIVDADEIELIDIHGCGGIMSTADNMLCYECYGARICGCCSEYSKDLKEYEGEYLCEYCIEDAEDKKEEEDHADLLFASLSTGKPDMFSDAMRWMWIG